jgi:hypothetical protein
MSDVSTSVSWSFDAPRIVEAIAELDIQRAAGILIEDQSVHFGTGDLSLARTTHFLRHQLCATASALSPSESLGAGVAIPYVYNTFLGEYLDAFASSPRKSDPFILQLEPLHLTIEYFDIGNSLHRRNFVVIPQLEAFTVVRERQECDIAYGYFEVTEED